MKSYILDINRCSIYDGPGLRTSIFLKGCPLKCKWCHNPESQSFKQQLRYFRDKCIGCQACQKVCPHQVHAFIENQHLTQHILRFEQCQICGQCIAVCPANALEQVGKEMSIKQIIDIIREDVPFYKKSKGGVTLSGGEPLSHSDFVLEILRACGEEGIHRCIETSGFGNHVALEKIVEEVDLFLVDYKVTGKQEHIENTGVPYDCIKDNMDFLMEKGKEVILRCPMIPGVNDTLEHLEGIMEISRNYSNITQIELLPYHKLGIGKATQVGMEQSNFREPTSEEVDKWILYCQNKGCSIIKRG